MSQKSVATNDTEPVSQSVFNEIIARNNQAKAEIHLENAARDAEASQTTDVDENEPQVDLLSSFQVELAPGTTENPEDDATYSSPQQTQTQLSQFPESQRFEQPSTTGKRRDSRGAEVKTPQLPRNPLAEHHSGILSRTGLGLTQVFQATQAQTSPFVHGVTSETRSDRPSPWVNTLARPVSPESNSSPLLRRKESCNNATEPYATYTTLEESQVNKPHKTCQETDEEAISEDDFDRQSTWVEQQKFERRRLEKRKSVFRTISSPHQESQGSSVSSSLREKQLMSSPPSVKRRRLDTSGQDMTKMISDDNKGPKDQNSWSSENNSEDETDRASDTRIAVRPSVPRRLQVDEEDKENIDVGAMHVPDTSRRPHELASNRQQDMSPSLAKAIFSQTQVIMTSPLQHGLPAASSQHIAVENSQPSPRARKRTVADANPMKSLTAQNTVSAPQPQHPPNGTHVSASPTRSQSLIHVGSNGMPVNGTAFQGQESNAETQQGSAPGKARDFITPTSVGKIIKAGQVHDYQLDQNAYHITEDTSKHPKVDEGLQGNTNSSQTCLPDMGQEELHLAPQTSVVKISQPSGDITGQAKPLASLVKTIPDGSLNGDNVSQPQHASIWETANTHLQQAVATSNSLPNLSHISSIYESPSGAKRKRMSAIIASASPQKLSEDTDFAPKDFLPEDEEFQEALKDSSPIRPGRNWKRRRLNENVGRVQEASKSEGIEINNATNNSTAAHQNPGSRSTASDQIFDFNSQSLPSSPIHQSKRVNHPKSRGTARGLSRPKKRLVEKMTTSTNNALSGVTKTKPLSNNTRPISDPAKQSSSTSSDKFNPCSESNSMKEEPIAPNQVFARYDAKTRGFYPARCLGVASGEHSRYTIQWDGYDPDEVDAHGVRRLELRIGDQVKIDKKGFPKVSHIVRGFKDTVDRDQCLTDGPVTDIFGNKTVVVAPKQRKSLPVDLAAEQCREIAVSNIYLDSNMWNQMKGRDFEFRQKISSQQGFATPPERPSTPSTPGSRTRRMNLPTDKSFSNKPGVFVGMAFAISYNDEIRRRSITNIIVQNGGQVLENGFQDLFDVQTVTSSSIPEQHPRKPSNDFELTLRARLMDLKFAALIADRHSRKAKYMQALALNLPCLSGRWIEDCVTKDSVADWQLYLLPSGDSVALDGATKSRILAPYDPQNSSLSTTLSNRPKLFSGQSVLIVKSKGKRDAKKDERHDDFAFLAQAMGASRITVAEDPLVVKSVATGQDESEGVCWIVTDENEKGPLGKIGHVDMSDASRGSSSKFVSFDFIIQSIILGSLINE